jgi:homeobox protein DLX2
MKIFFFFVSFSLGLSPPSSQSAGAPWDQKPPPSHWNGQPNPMGNLSQIDHKPPQMPPQTHVPPPQHPQMGGYMPQYWYQPETNPSLLT